MHEALGIVLLEMGDKIEAGRFLFISGGRNEKYQSAIEAFLNRFANSSAHQLHSSLPSRARAMQFSELPAPVQSELIQRGFSEKELKSASPVDSRQGFKAKLNELFLLCVVVAT